MEAHRTYIDKHRQSFMNKKRIVVKIGSSSLTHLGTGKINLVKMERLVRILTDLRNMGKDVVLVSSGSIAVGRQTFNINEKPKEKALSQACAAVGQARLIMIYQKFFAEYSQISAQVLMTKDTMLNPISRENALNTFEKLFEMNVIPVVNENDTVSTDEIEFGDNDTLSAIVTALIDADLLILLSDIDGLFTDDPNVNPEAKFIDHVDYIDEKLENMCKGSNGSLGTGGMATKIAAARIATDSGADMVIANGKDVHIIEDIFEGKNVGTLFTAHKNKDFVLLDYLKTPQYGKY
ncbi:MAG: glutamate 5-kinase [Clostridiales bacterium]|nr:glutamate 5-kinase [Clostridiales bacterium]